MRMEEIGKTYFLAKSTEASLAVLEGGQEELRDLPWPIITIILARNTDFPGIFLATGLAFLLL